MMVQRCENPKHKKFKHYGGRGIKVCKRWRENFGLFYQDMGPRPSPAHEIDRIENDGHYEPTNCEWTTKIKNRGKTRKTDWVSLRGERISFSECARRLNIPRRRLQHLVENQGLTIAQIEKMPSDGVADHSVKLVIVDGVEMKFGEAAHTLGLSRQMLKYWFNRGLSIEEIKHRAKNRRAKNRKH